MAGTGIDRGRASGGIPDGEAQPIPSPPTVAIKACPIATSLGSLGRRWTLPILRDIAFFPDVSFGFILKSNRGLGPRTLSLRLRQLAEDGLVRKETSDLDPRHPTYRLTPKGLEVWPVLASLFQFGIRNHSDVVFEDRRPRDLSEVYPHDAELMLGPLVPFARTLPEYRAQATGTRGRSASAESSAAQR